MSRGETARVWPGRAALEQAAMEEVTGSPSGLLFTGREFTQENFLPRLLDGAALPGGRQPLAELTGTILVHNLLLERELADGVLAGLAAGWRLPRRLWRLLVELKAAGLERLPADSPSPRLAALARLLAAYGQSLGDLGLADQADGLAALMAGLDRGEPPPAARSWRGVILEEVLWLRTLDQRLMAALSHHLPVRVRFGLTPERHTPRALAKLLASTAAYLERTGGPGLELEWRELGQGGGPLADLARAQLAGGRLNRDPGRALIIRRAAGRYGEAEALAEHALALLNSGAAAEDILLTFPDLTLYGQMLADVAYRRGLPLELDQAATLGDTPPARAVLSLLSLPLGAYDRETLARVLESPYLRPGLARQLGGDLPARAGRLLSEAGYIDAHETPVRETLERAAARRNGDARMRSLARACGWLTAWLEDLLSGRDLAAYCAGVKHLLEVLDLPAAALEPGPGKVVAGLPSGAALAVRDLMAARALERGAEDLEQAARQAGTGPSLSGGRLLSLVRQVWEETPAPARRGSAGGVRVLPLSQARGLRPAHLLVGGLNQDEFPSRPPGQYLLSGEERLALGRRAGLPVWRTEEEEYGGQVMNLLSLVAGTRQGVVLSCGAADADGSERLPAFLLGDLARLTGREDDLAAPRGGAFGELPPLPEAREPLALWGGLTRNLLRPRVGMAQDKESARAEVELARAALAAMATEPAALGRWQRLCGLVEMEAVRLSLDSLPGETRVARSDAFSGLLAGSGARDLLAVVLAAPEARRLSPLSLESYAVCPMAWFLGRMLGLKPPREPSWALERDAEGRWVHAALKAYFDPEAYPRLRGPERLGQCLAEARADLSVRGEAGHPAVWDGRQGAILAALERAVAREEDDLTGWRVEAVEKELGPQDGLSVVVDQGEPLLLVGRLDRLESSPRGLRVADYKHTSQAGGITGPLRRADLGVYSFQMPVYLAAARRLAGGNAPVTGRVVPTRLVNLGPREEAFPSEDALLREDPEGRAAAAAQGEVNLFNAIAGLWARLSGGDFVPRPDQADCTYCDLSPVCRARQTPGAVGEGG